MPAVWQPGAQRTTRPLGTSRGGSHETSVVPVLPLLLLELLDVLVSSLQDARTVNAASVLARRANIQPA
jgi:hypothetical protein